MTELEIKVDQEIGNDTEQSRLNFLKYVQYGRQLEREAAVNAVKAALDEVDAVLKSVTAAQVEVEKNDEDAKFAELQALAADGPIKEQMITAFAEILATVDQKHVEIIKNQRDPALAAIRAKYVPSEG
jgi:competence protein ComGC